MGRANQLGCREVEMYSAILKPFCWGVPSSLLPLTPKRDCCRTSDPLNPSKSAGWEVEMVQFIGLQLRREAQSWWKLTGFGAGNRSREVIFAGWAFHDARAAVSGHAWSYCASTKANWGGLSGAELDRKGIQYDFCLMSIWNTHVIT
jgi:hypothetical protein